MKTLFLTLTAVFTLFFAIPIHAAIYISAQGLNILVPAGWSMVAVSEPFALGGQTCVRMYLVNNNTGNCAIWLVALQ